MRRWVIRHQNGFPLLQLQMYLFLDTFTCYFAIADIVYLWERDIVYLNGLSCRGRVG